MGRGARPYQFHLNPSHHLAGVVRYRKIPPLSFKLMSLEVGTTVRPGRPASTLIIRDSSLSTTQRYQASSRLARKRTEYTIAWKGYLQQMPSVYSQSYALC